MDQLPAGQPVLGIPMDRERMAARAVSAAHRRDRLAGSPPRRLSRLATAAQPAICLYLPRSRPDLIGADSERGTAWPGLKARSSSAGRWTGGSTTSLTKA